VKASSLGPAGLALAALLLVCVIAPPEVRGLGLAAAAFFVALAVAVTSGASAASPARIWIVMGLPPALLISRCALAPGEAVEPTAVFFVAGFAGAAAAASALAPDRLAGLYVAFAAFSGGRALYETVWGLAGSASLLQAADPGGVDPAVLNRLEQGRPYGGFATPAALGCFLAMTIPPVAAWALGKTGRLRALGLAAAAVGTAGLIATRSVTAMAALAAALALASLRGRVSRRIVTGALAAIAIAVVGAGVVRPDAVFAPGRADSPWRLRAGNVRIALEEADDHPLTGVGPGGYAEAFPQYRRAGDNESRHAHDLPAELIAEWGVPAGLALSALFFWIFLSPLVALDKAAQTFGSGLAVGLAAFAIHNLVDFTAFLPSLLLIAAVGRGLLARPAPGARSGLPVRIGWTALAVTVCLAAAASGLAREALFQAHEAAASADHARAQALARRAGRIAPWDADPPQFSAGAALAATPSEPAAALAAAERAVRAAPARASARWSRAQARSVTGDAPGAYADLVEASRLYPLKAEYATQRDVLADALRKASAGAPR